MVAQERRPKEADDAILPSDLAVFVPIRRVNMGVATECAILS